MMGETTEADNEQEETATDAAEASAEEAGAKVDDTADEEKVELKPLKDSEAKGTAVALGQSGEIDLDALMDVPVTLSVEIGKKRMPIQELISLTPGSIVELDRELSSPLDLLVNGTLIARGEVVVIGKSFGLRLVDVVSPKERIQKLK